MKKILLRAFTLLLVLCLVLGIAACGNRGKTLLSLKKDGISVTFSVNEYQLMLSLQKGDMAYTIRQYYGDYNSEDFWGTVVDSDGTTYNDYYNRAILEKAANYLSAMALFDEMGLKLPDSYVEEVDAAMAEFVDYDGEGSKSAFNRILSPYGMNYNKLREYKIMTAKVSYLEDYLYGAGGDKIGKAVKDEYYEANYVAFKQILLANYYYVYETDANGDVIYFDTGTSKDVLYDKVNGTPKTDDKGHTVYYREDGSIAYDTVNGKPSPVFNEDGTEKIAKYTGEQLEALVAKKDAVLAQVKGVDAGQFETIRKANSDDVSGGLYYLSTAVTYAGAGEGYAYMDTIAKKLAEMQVGETALVETDFGYHVIMKYELEKGAYEATESENWFKDENYYLYDFTTNLKNQLFLDKLAPYKSRVTVNADLWETVQICDVAPNYYYY